MPRNLKKRFLICFLGILILSLAFSYSSYADGAVQTNVFGNLKDDGKGCGIFTILGFVVDTLSIGVGVLGVISIMVMGIQYLTAKGNEEQVIRAKKRLFAILLGIVAYALMYSGLQFLMPGGKFNTNQRCETMSDKEYAQMKAEEENEARAKAKAASDSESNSKNETRAKKNEKKPYAKSQSYEKCMKNAAQVVKNDVCKIEDPALRISKTAKLLIAGSNGAKATPKYKSAYNEMKTNMSECESYGKACNTFVATVLAASGVDPSVPSGRNGHTSNNTRDMYNHFLNNPKIWKNVGHNPLKSKEGDIVVKPRPGGHITITVKNSKGKLVTAHASNCGFYPKLSGGIWTGYTGTPTVFRYIGN